MTFYRIFPEIRNPIRYSNVSLVHLRPLPVITTFVSRILNNHSNRSSSVSSVNQPLYDRTERNRRRKNKRCCSSLRNRVFSPQRIKGWGKKRDDHFLGPGWRERITTGEKNGVSRVDLLGQFGKLYIKSS